VTENSRELDRVVHGYRTELRIWHRAGISAQAKDGGVLTQESFRECGAIREVLMQNLSQLGVRDAELPAADSGHTADGRMVKCVTKSVATDHSTPADDYNPLLADRRNVHLRLRGNASEPVESIG
jgi:hypothetical protein